jgi:hypothetical protein
MAVITVVITYKRLLSLYQILYLIKLSGDWHKCRMQELYRKRQSKRRLFAADAAILTVTRAKSVRKGYRLTWA